MTFPLVQVTAVHGSEVEIRNRALLLKLLCLHDLSRWAFVRDVQFDGDSPTGQCAVVGGQPRVTLRPLAREQEERLGARRLSWRPRTCTSNCIGTSN